MLDKGLYICNISLTICFLFSPPKKNPFYGTPILFHLYPSLTRGDYFTLSILVSSLWTIRTLALYINRCKFDSSWRYLTLLASFIHKLFECVYIYSIEFLNTHIIKHTTILGGEGVYLYWLTVSTLAPLLAVVCLVLLHPYYIIREKSNIRL